MIVAEKHSSTTQQPRLQPVGRQRIQRTDRSWLLLTFVLIGALAGLCVLYLLQTWHVVQLGYELTRLQSERDAVALETTALRYEIAERQGLARVADLATREYGMIPVRRVFRLEVERPTWTLPASSPQTVQLSRWHQILDTLYGVGRAQAEEQP